jgi:DtxR family Mn-dependent transcriptional regulator
MYLVTLALLMEAGLQPPVPLSLLSEELAIQPVSANQMVRKLEESGLVDYFPYKGVSLTDQGQRLAWRVLRYRRLWEVFLVQSLKIEPVEASALACKMEHILSDEAVESLDQFLGRPTASPLGKPIPNSEARVLLHTEIPLTRLPAGGQGLVTRLGCGATEQAFLTTHGVNSGAWVQVLAKGDDGAALLRLGDKTLSLAETLAQAIWVSAPPSAPNDKE